MIAIGEWSERIRKVRVECLMNDLFFSFGTIELSIESELVDPRSNIFIINPQTIGRMFLSLDPRSNVFIVGL